MKCPDPVSPVHTDGSEVENGRGAAHDVEGDPGVAQRISEHPARVVHLHQFQQLQSQLVSKTNYIYNALKKQQSLRAVMRLNI